VVINKTFILMKLENLLNIMYYYFPFSQIFPSVVKKLNFLILIKSS